MFSSYELIDCFPIINANRRSTVPLADSQLGDAAVTTFFPFEPYLLIQSGVYINANDSYLEYVGEFSSFMSSIISNNTVAGWGNVKSFQHVLPNVTIF